MKKKTDWKELAWMSSIVLAIQFLIELAWPGPVDIGTLLFLPITVIFPGYLCYKMAQKINKNYYVAFFIGGFLSIFGLLGYWLYYYTEKKKFPEEALKLSN